MQKSQLIVSLTSYPARIHMIHNVIESLINQTYNADKIILWLNPESFPSKETDLPSQLLKLPTTLTLHALGAQTAKCMPLTPSIVIGCAPSTLYML